MRDEIKSAESTKSVEDLNLYKIWMSGKEEAQK
jgi:hypothetical protein